MKNRINLIIITVLSFALLFLNSCNDDEFIEETPTTFYTVENSFNSVSQVDASITNMYVHIRYWFQTNYFLKGLGTDYLDSPFWRISSSGYSNYSLWTAEQSDVQSIWDAMYMLISYANQTMGGIEESDFVWTDEEEYDFAIAQTKFFRGFSYLTLGELFGGVPLVDQLYTTPAYDFTRSTRKETYLFAIQDLEDAAEGMPDYPSEAGRVAKGVTYHYLSEAYLALATILDNDNTYLQNSIDYATKATELHSLMTSRFGSRATQRAADDINGVDNYYEDGDVFFDLFQRGNYDYSEGNTEALWTLQNDYTVYLQYNQGNNFVSHPRNMSPVLRDVKWSADYIESNDSPWPSLTSAYVGGRGVSFNAPTDYVQETIWEGDYWDDMRNSPVNIRRDFVCMDSTSSYFGDTVTLDMLNSETLERMYPIWTKFAPIDDWGYEDLADGGDIDGALRSNMYQDEYACRLAETYLIRAEAYMRLGDNVSAATDINVLRTRAECDYLVTSADVSLDLILDERARELFFEERRWCTLLRMSGTIAIGQINKYSYYAGSENTYFLGAIAQPDGWSLFPIPQETIDANLDAEIEQNEGWE